MFEPGDDLAELRGSEAIDPTEYLEENGYPCNTIITNPFKSDDYNDTEDSNLTYHEGIDFSSWRKRV